VNTAQNSLSLVRPNRDKIKPRRMIIMCLMTNRLAATLLHHIVVPFPKNALYTYRFYGQKGTVNALI
jgi:hypothetical protein